MPAIASVLDSQVADVEEMKPKLDVARSKPHVRDAATLDRVVKFYSEAHDSADLYSEQIRRWRHESPTDQQMREIERLEDQAHKLREGAQYLVDLAMELRPFCIDAIMAMSDEELGLAVLSGRLKRP
jgi:hypothetical protein